MASLPDQAFGKNRDANACPNDDGTPNGPCAEFDLVSDAAAVINPADIARFSQLFGGDNGPKCADCLLPNLP